MHFLLKQSNSCSSQLLLLSNFCHYNTNFVSLYTHPMLTFPAQYSAETAPRSFIWMSCKEDSTRISSSAESLLVSISTITASSVSCLESEKEYFLEIGCYFYRASIAIKELQTAEDIPTIAIQAVQSLSRSVCLAKDLLEDCNNCAITDSEARSVVEKLEGEIKLMGEALSLIPPMTYGDQEYAESAIRSLSEEMQNVRFEACEKPTSQSNELRQEPESDLYPVNVEESTESSQIFSTQHMVNLPKSITKLPQLVEYMEPLYDTFLCPLTNQIMDDPVTIQSGVTYERKAITEWFEKFEESEEIHCPTSGGVLLSRVLSSNMALKTTIGSWRERNETARIKVARAALSLGSSDVMVLEAIDDLRRICQIKEYNMVQVRNLGMLPLLVKFVESNDKNVRYAALDLLRELAEADKDNKEMLAKILDVSIVIEMLSSSHQQIRHASLLFLLEFSKSQSLCKKLGSATGGILMLITAKYNQSTDPFASNKADEILRNLECTPSNIMRMAENGLLEPLLRHLTEGNESTKTEMAGYLGEIVLGDDIRTYVAERACPSLIKMVHTGNTLARREALRALVQISSCHPNGKILIGFGIVEVMVDELFTRRIYDEPMNSKEEAAAVLANILEYSGLELENLQVNTHGHTLTSDYVVCNLICMLKNSMPDKLNINLIRILLCLTKFPKSSSTIVSVVRETDASYILLEFINNPDEQLGVAAIKLLIFLSPFMGHMIAGRLCKIRGQPESLIQSPTGAIQITERQAVSASLLAKLPHQSLVLNLVLINKNAVPTILQEINQIRRSGTRRSKYAGTYLEGLVGILVRFTTTLYESQVLLLARTHNFTLIFTELLMQASSDEVQRLSAVGLENLSSESINLSEPPQIVKPKPKKVLCMFLSFRSSKMRKLLPVCPIHRGACSSQNTFCLVEANAVERLLACLDHENAEVVEAALSALCTLLDDKVDVDKSVNMLSEANTLNHVLNVVKTHRQEGLWQKSFWVIEKFLMKEGDKSVSDISQDRFLPATLVSAFHHGDKNTSQIAEKILRHLNKMPSFSTSDCTM